jgi:hypothetical protein
MIFMIIKWVLGFAGGGVLDKYLKYLQAKADTETERERIRTQVTIEDIKAEIALQSERRLIITAQLGHPVAWIPRFGIELFVMFYVIAIIIDKMFDLPGEISDLPGPIAAIMVTVIGGMFLQSSAAAIGSSGQRVIDAIKSRRS